MDSYITWVKEQKLELVKKTKEIVHTKLENADIEDLKLLYCSEFILLFEIFVVIKKVIKTSHSAAG